MINLIPGWVEPADMREIKRLSALLEIPTILFPDTSDVLDAPQTGKHEFYPKGGTTVNALRRTGASRATFALGPTASEPGARHLETKLRVPARVLELPIGLRAPRTASSTRCGPWPTSRSRARSTRSGAGCWT